MLDQRTALGTTVEGYRVIVEVYFGPDRYGNAERRPTIETITHETIPHPDVLSICGEVIDLRHFGRGISCGQTVDEVRAITRPAGTLTADDLARFADLWDAWHLNTMRAACAHMNTTIPKGAVLLERYGRPDVLGWRIDNLVCPVTGYTYGHAWLAEVIPDEIIVELTALLAKAAPVLVTTS